MNRFNRNVRMGRLRPRRRLRRNRNKIYQNFATSSKPVRYGPGKNTAIINTFHTTNNIALTRVSINSDLLNNQEFMTKISMFKFFKIKYIKAIFYPNGQASGLIYVNLNWYLTSSSLTMLQKDDSTKMTTVYRTRTKIFTWLPPRMIMNVNSTSETVPLNFINPSEFIGVERVVDLPGWLYVFNDSNFNFNFNVEIKVEFRGNDYFNTENKMKNALKLLERLKIKEEVKKEEKQEEKEEEVDWKAISESEEEEEIKEEKKEKDKKKKVKKGQ